MQIASIHIENVKGIETLDIQAGALTVISGANGQGKTSVIDAIRAAFEGGHNPALIRVGAKKAVVKMILTDGTEIARTITDRKSEAVITTKDGDNKAKPESYLKSLAEGVALDPIAFLALPPKKRGEFLMETSAISFSEAEIEKATGRKAEESLGLDGIDKLRRTIYEERTKHNVLAKEADGQEKGLRQSLPEGMDKDWIAEADRLNAEYVEVKGEGARLEAEAKAALGDVESDIKSRLGEMIRALEISRDEELKVAQAEWTEQVNTATKDVLERTSELSAALREAKAKAEEQGRAKHLQTQIAAAIDRFRLNGRAADKLTKALENLDTLKVKKLAEDGIEGMEIRDGEVYVGGIAFDALNTQQQYEVAFMIAARGVGHLPIMICDRAESFDAANWQQFCEVAKSSGIQVVAARVTDGPLKVEVAA